MATVYLALDLKQSYRPTQLMDAIGVPTLSRHGESLLPKQVFVWNARLDRPRFLQWFDGE